MKSTIAVEIKTANDYWNYLRNVVSKYKDKPDNDGKRIITTTGN